MAAERDWPVARSDKRSAIRYRQPSIFRSHGLRFQQFFWRQSDAPQAHCLQPLTIGFHQFVQDQFRGSQFHA
jgi:hypothetical protein